ncbi:autotransporter outer membrane beta-barrel domain-containing protein [Variovorax sp. J22R133]|uniref:autotransporter outer membrane beta-barrel domain-containing protein n=1 Tax=Variovorax brevis TaxID=3053503 RepID=UPI0025790F09|nr:autotransporter outer membrane beta-barrel domain-containing protein [Variovorax sp. J22R133]MDM0117105.1 autotransporter outer membrane beta-barrel domain-containing protein [Variovorax sp. J22R133]
MNKSYRSIYNPVLGAWVAVSEITRARGKRSTGAAGLTLALVAFTALPASAQTVQYWDTTGATAGTGTAPNGTWNAGNSNWTTAPAGDAATSTWLPGSAAVFSAGTSAIDNYTVTMEGDQTAAGLSYQGGNRTSVLTLANPVGETLTLAGPSTPVIDVAAGTTLVIQPVIAGTAGLVKSGGGTVQFVGANTYSGDTAIEGGVLQVATDSQLGASSGNLSLANGGTLRLGADNFASARAITLGAGGGAIDVNAKQSNTLSGAITGGGPLTLFNSGLFDGTELRRLTLAGNNTSTGGTRIGVQGVNEGRTNVAVEGANNLGTGPVDLYFNSELLFNGSAAHAGGLTITTHESSNTLGTNSGTQFSGGASAGTAHITNGGAGAYIYFDGTSTAANAVIDNNGGRVGFIGASSGGSATVNNHSGFVMLGDTADMAGTTIHNTGTVFVSNAATGMSVGALDGGGNVVLGSKSLTVGALGQDGTISGVISDKGAGYRDLLNRPYVDDVSAIGGSLVKVGAGTLTLSGNNSYTGSTTVDAGTLRIEGDQSLATGGIAVNSGATLSSGPSGIVAGAVTVQDGATLSGNGKHVGAVTMASGSHLAPGNGAGLTVSALTLNSGTQLDYQLGQAGTVGGASNSLLNVNGDLNLAGTLNVAQSSGGSFGAGLYRLVNYSGALIGNTLVFGNVPGNTSDLYLQTSVAKQVNLINTAGGTLNFWDGGNAGSVNNSKIDGGSGVMTAGASEHWTDANGSANAPWSQNAFAIFGGAAGTVTVDSSGGAVFFSGAQFAVDGYTVDGDTIQTNTADTLIRVGDGSANGASYTATISAPIAGTGGIVKGDLGTLVLAAANGYAGGTTLNEGTLLANNDQALGTGKLTINGGTLGTQTDATLANPIVVAGDFAIAASKTAVPTLTLNGDVDLAATARVTQTTQGTVNLAGAISGSHGISFDATAPTASYLLTGSKSNTYTGVTTVQGNAVLGLARTGGATAIPGDLNVDGQGVVRLQASEQIVDTAKVTVASTGQAGRHGFEFAGAGMTETIGSLHGAGTVGLAGSKLVVGAGDFSGQISDGAVGGGQLEKVGAGTLALSGTNTYSGATTVSGGRLVAGAASAFSPGSAHTVAAGATLETGGFNQTVSSLVNSGTVSLLSTTVGSKLTVRGNYVGNGGTLQLGAVLNGSGPSDQLVIDGASAQASGRTTVQVVNRGALGAPTTGSGIEIIAARNGATTTAQSSKDAFALANGHVDAGPYQYRLVAADANGAGESWYLSSRATPDPDGLGKGTVVAGSADPNVAQLQSYNTQVSLLAGMPAQMRQSDTTMLSNLHRRVGDEDSRVQGFSVGERRAWGRIIGADLDIQQKSFDTSPLVKPVDLAPSSQGHVDGFQVGTDLFAAPGSDWRLGIYVGQLDGDAQVSGLHGDPGAWGSVGRSELRSQYLAGYATYTTPAGFYADAVVQVGRHDYTLRPNDAAALSGKGRGVQASLEIGQSIGLGDGWIIEPQAQLVNQRLDVYDVDVGGLRVKNEADGGWLARAGVRLKGEMATPLGRLQPYGRVNVYYATSGNDNLRQISPAGTSTIATTTGYTSVEVAGGLTLTVTPRVSLYGELGRLFDMHGDSRVSSSIEGSAGMRVRW